MELNIDSGIQKVTLNGVGSVDVFFNPTDTNFMERLYLTFEKLDKKQNEKDMTKGDAKKAFYSARKLDAEMRQDIDNLFEVEVSNTLFGGINCFALADGVPIWANLLLGIIDMMDDTLTAERAKTDAKIAKYTNKYKHK